MRATAHAVSILLTSALVACGSDAPPEAHSSDLAPAEAADSGVSPGMTGGERPVTAGSGMPDESTGKPPLDERDAGVGLPPEKPADAGALESNDAATLQPTVVACTDACQKQADCVGLDVASCIDECLAQAQLLAARGCTAEGDAQNTCLATLSCESLKRFATAGQRSHETCGDEATAFFASCTVGAGTPPAECVSVCDRYESCALLTVDSTSCVERCTLQVTDLTFRDDATCGSAFLALRGCGSGASCDSLRAWVERDEPPAECATQAQTFAAECSP